MSNAEELMKTLLEQLKGIAMTETVIGEAFQAGEVSVIPVTRVSIGIGVGGGGQAEKQEGVGGGGGIKVEPIAFLVVKGENVSLLNIGRGKGLDALYERVPELIDKVVEKVSDRTGKKEKGSKQEKAAPGTAESPVE